jgi:AraC-like DNA-binding protein
MASCSGPSEKTRQSADAVLLTMCDSRLIVSVPAQKRRSPSEAPAASIEKREVYGTDALPALNYLTKWLETPPIGADALVRRLSAIVAAAKASRMSLHRRGGLANWQMLRAFELLGKDLHEPIDLDAVAASCRISRKHFTRAFRSSAGVAPYQWRLSKRIAYARQLLLESNISMCQVATRCGFQSLSHFSRAFSQALGLSPRQWRRTFIFRSMVIHEINSSPGLYPVAQASLPGAHSAAA